MSHHNFVWNVSDADKARVPLGFYEHFKTGARYVVLKYAINCETNRPSVGYKRCDRMDSDMLFRSIDDFCEHIENHPDRPDYVGPRFRRVSLAA